jgi:hypothetical protein
VLDTSKFNPPYDAFALHGVTAKVSEIIADAQPDMDCASDFVWSNIRSEAERLVEAAITEVIGRPGYQPDNLDFWDHVIDSAAARVAHNTKRTPRRDVLAEFSAAIFKNANSNGFVSLRAFRDDGEEKPAIFIEPITLGDPAYLGVVFERAKQAAEWKQPAVFCPPVSTFSSGKSAKASDIHEGVTLSVDCDAFPEKASQELQAVLGPPTIVVASGGEHINPSTGEVERKRHMHWRLKVPTRTPAEHALLLEARQLATAMVGADATGTSLAHPFRWPGSIHRKGEPKLAEIIESNDIEIDLDEALALLRDVTGQRYTTTDGFTVFETRGQLASNPEHVALALREIPNKDRTWDGWNYFGMAAWAATGGSEIGFTAFAEWSAKSPKYNEKATRDRWDHYKKSPPTSVGYGTLVFHARAANPAWMTKSEDIQPINLWEKLDAPSIPRGILPTIIENYAVTQSRALGADMAGIAMTAIVACATAIPDSKVRLQVRQNNQGWIENARLWCMLVGPPSTKKTPSITAAVHPIGKINQELTKANAEEMAKYNKLSAKEKKLEPPPVQRELLIHNATIEAAQMVFKDSPDGLLCYYDELSGFFGAMDKYSSAKGASADRAFWLQAYNGGAMSAHRIMRGNVYIDNVSACMIGGIQPESIASIAGDCLDDGLLQRFLPIVLQPSLVGTDEPLSEDVTDYNRMVRHLYELRDQAAVTLKFDEGAQRVRDELGKKHHAMMTGVEIMSPKLASHFGKYDGFFARLCVVFHCVDHSGNTPPQIIPQATAERAAALLHSFLLRHAMLFYQGVLGVAEGSDVLQDVAGYILAHRKETLANRDMERGSQAMKRLNGREVEEVFRRLDAMGWISREPEPAGRPGRRNELGRWTVNPRVHTEFADRAKEELERRTEVRKLLNGLRGKG